MWVVWASIERLAGTRADGRLKARRRGTRELGRKKNRVVMVTGSAQAGLCRSGAAFRHGNEDISEMANRRTDWRVAAGGLAERGAGGVQERGRGCWSGPDRGSDDNGG